MVDPGAYTVRLAVPDVDTYRELRTAAGLSAKTLEAAERGLRNTLFAVQILSDGQVVGMGRVIGDGGCFYQVVDVAVLPAHQGKGLGKQMATAPKSVAMALGRVVKEHREAPLPRSCAGTSDRR